MLNSVRRNFSKFLLLIHDVLISIILLKISIIAKGFLGDYGLFYIKPNLANYFKSIWWVSLFLIFIFIVKGIYSKRLSFWDEAREIFVSAFFTIILGFSLIYLTKKPEFPRSILFFYFVFTIIIFPLSRHFFKIFLSKIGLYTSNILIIGANETGKLVAKALLDDSELGFSIVGFLDDEIKGEVKINGERYNVLGKIEEYSTIIPQKNIDAVVIAQPDLGEEKLEKLAADVQSYVRKLYLVPKMKKVSTSNAELYHLFDEQMFLLKIHNNLQYGRNKFFKTIFDIILAILLIPFLIPLIFIIGLIIKLDSKGPVFFRHERVGKGGKKIKVFKFRTMYKDAEERLKEILEKDEEARKEWEKYFKLKNDPRITKVGKFLRKTSLDELPQLFNVLKGEMSFVGPRPVVEDEIKMYYKEYAKFYYSVKPGITGLWQISGRNDVDYDNRVKLDTWYVLNWSMWLDIMILFKTVFVVLNKKGAY
ncbi:undecaprenyl-phosphate galactose phosphotransferase [Thermotomaculum hydrothermale]|uniref:Undecaprenyl-phosphate galactose phosphotransferase n=1 Tax=Thermotomaculum hydrothermale TaxID=981385 RepID=A0A7R6PGQ1_9BACT|nr:sugar transferase [Thermotomaculum hydrothermale]BBB33409.1 undecaprenyl-phosphate galactose phosphotransferase [Thermotomaculum hydrothermale]